VAALKSEVEAEKRETEASWMAKIQLVEKFNRSSRVTDIVLLYVHAVGHDILNYEREIQTPRGGRQI
jgi:hypothetical protein